MNFMEKLLSKSNSYVYYKNNYNKLLNSQKKLKEDNKFLKKHLDHSKEEIIKLQKRLGNYSKHEILDKILNEQYSDLTIAIKSPNPKGHHHWGDYFFSIALKKSFKKLGFNVIIQEREDWYNGVKVDINIVLRGAERYEPKFDEINIMWNISHPDWVNKEEYELYDICFISSEKYANKINNEVNAIVKPLLQCTDPEVFYNSVDESCFENILFVGVTRGVYRKIIKDVMQTDFDVSIYGMEWEDFVDEKYIKGQFIPNDELHKYYSSCKILLNDHWEDMRDWDFPSNRLFDALACGAFVISDKIPSAETLFEGSIVTYDDVEDLNDKIDYYLIHENERKEKAQKGREIILKNHTFDNRVDTIVDSLKNLQYDNHVLNQMELLSYQKIEQIFNKLNQKISIIVKICNNFENLRKCIDSLFMYTTGDYEIVLINECQYDKQINNFLDLLKSKHNVRILNYSDYNYFSENIDNDLILLDSNTIVSSNWLQKLIICAYSKDNIGIVTPFSNDFRIFPISTGMDDIIPNEMDVNIIANLVEKSSKRMYIELPLGNNFCMYVKHEVLNEMGGYNLNKLNKLSGLIDYSLEVIKNGWKIIMDGSTYVHHNISEPFSENSHWNNFRLNNNFQCNLRRFLCSNDLNLFLNNIKQNIGTFSKNNNPKKNILFVLHGGGGGTVYHTTDLMHYVEKNYNCYLLVSNSCEVILYKFSNCEKYKLCQWKLNSNWVSENIHDDEFSRIYFHILTYYSIDLVHIQHLIHHTFDLPKIGKQLNIPIFLSFHDFYFICLSHNLIDGNDKYCAGDCEDRVDCYDRMDLSNHSKINNFIPEWRNHVEEMFSNIDLFITPSNVSKDIYTKYYPIISDKIRVVSHGRDIEHIDVKLFDVPSLSKPIKILFIGNTYLQKGSEIIKELSNIDKENRLELHFLGDVDSELNGIGIHHGRYKREDLMKLIEEINPSFIGIFSIWPETFCYTLTEAWAFNIPVLMSKIGILQERLLINDGGWFIDYENMENTYSLILEISSNKETYLSKIENINNFTFKSVEDMGKEYIEFYKYFL